MGSLVLQQKQAVHPAYLKYLMNIGLLGAGTGAAFRSAQGLASVAQGKGLAAPAPAIAPPIINLPLPKTQAELQEEQALEQARKERLQKLLDMPGQAAHVIKDTFTGKSQDLGDTEATESYGKAAELGDDFNPKIPWQRWYGAPTVVPAAIAGVAGGWKLTDWLLDARRKAVLKAELESSKKDFEAALQSQYSQKASALGYDLDQLYDQICLQKEAQKDRAPHAQSWNWWSDTIPSGFGLYSLLGLGLGAGAHKLMYDRTKAQSEAKALAEGRKRFVMNRTGLRPTEIYAMPSDDQDLQHLMSRGEAVIQPDN